MPIGQVWVTWPTPLGSLSRTETVWTKGKEGGVNSPRLQGVMLSLKWGGDSGQTKSQVLIPVDLKRFGQALPLPVSCSSHMYQFGIFLSSTLMAGWWEGRERRHSMPRIVSPSSSFVASFPQFSSSHPRPHMEILRPEFFNKMSRGLPKHKFLSVHKNSYFHHFQSPLGCQGMFTCS